MGKFGKLRSVRHTSASALPAAAVQDLPLPQPSVAPPPIVTIPKTLKRELRHERFLKSKHQ